jgi:hypothetical protein
MDPNLLDPLKPEDQARLASPDKTVSEKDRALYEAWTELLEWLRAYATDREGAVFVKQADFPDYIYRMERPYDLPTTIMSASLSTPARKPVLLAGVSPRHAVLKEVTLHPFESHVYRKLKCDPASGRLLEGKRPFTKEMLYALADELFRHA